MCLKRRSSRIYFILEGSRRKKKNLFRRPIIILLNLIHACVFVQAKYSDTET